VSLQLFFPNNDKTFKLKLTFRVTILKDTVVKLQQR